MEKEVDNDIIKATQATLGKFVKRPPLTEKLLRRPPFRFLHDIITTVLKTTGFFGGLFNEEELISENVKDKESKINFLNKVITVLGLATGKSISAKPSKIVAGQEAEKTNELLQYLANALEQKISSDEAVEQYKEKFGKDKHNKSIVENNKELKNIKDKTKDKSPLGKKSTEPISKLNSREKVKPIKNKPSNSVIHNEAINKNSTQQSTLNKKNQAIVKNLPHDKPSIVSKDPLVSSSRSKTEHLVKKSQPDKSENQINNEELNAHINNSPGSAEIIKQLVGTDCEENKRKEATNNGIDENGCDQLTSESEVNNFNTDYIQQSIESNKKHFEKNLSLENHEKNDLHEKVKQADTNTKEIHDNINRNEVKTNDVSTERPVSVRPSSSRPGAPRLKEKYDSVIHSETNALRNKVHIIEENAHNDEDEENSIILVDTETANVDALNENLEADQNSHLVQQILDSQKELSHGTSKIELHSGTRKEERDAFYQDIELVKYNIQALSRVANPLGKLLDHIQEDVELMRHEKQNWKKTYDDISKQLTKQKLSNDESLLTLKAKSKQLDVNIEEKQEKINDLKVAIHKYYLRIDKLLSSGNIS